MTKRSKLTVAYLGGGFQGWQRQPRGRTVQGELERALEIMTGGVSTTVVGAGRTDAGVHAAGQVAHVDLPVRIPSDGLLRGLNQHLPEDIRVRSVRPTTSDFHARRDALGKHYTYRARWREPQLPWHGLRAAAVPPVCDVEALEAAAQRLLGLHDMASFTLPECATAPSQRTLYRLWVRHLPGGLDLHFVGDGFLRYQVRRMVGALLAVARARMTMARFAALVEDPQPGAPIETAPARGLTLERVMYRRSPVLALD
jgi:tRNA pseudouridine38-40 synthase